jgi:hypothetical protein
MMRTIGAWAILFLMLVSSASGVTGGFGLALGAAMPQGQSNRYAGDSFSLEGYGLIGSEEARVLNLRFSFQGIFLERTEHDVNLGGWCFTEAYSTNLLKFAVGPEVVPIRGALEPYGGLGMGIYYFTKDVSLRNWLDEEVDSRKLSSEVDFGWNVNGGIRLYLGKSIGAYAGVEYDNIVGMESLKARGGQEDAYLGSSSLDSEFFSVFVGVHLRVR